MQHEVTFAGFGGQGIMLMGQMLAYSGMDDGFHVTWLPSYGPEMRGGTAYCTVVVSDKEISSPVISTPEVVVVMNRPSLEKFAPTVRKGGFIFINSSLIPERSGRTDVTEVLIPCNEIAQKIGNIRSTNIIMLGALVGRAGIVSEKAVKGRIEYTFKRKGDDVVAQNYKAFDVGRDAATQG